MASTRRPPWRLKVAAALGIGAAAYVVDRWLTSGGATVLTAVVAAATVAYCWFSYDLVAAAAADRHDRVAETVTANRVLLERMLVELRQNIHRRGQTQAWYAHVPFEMTAFNDARHLFVSMPQEVWTHVAEIASRTARYNTVAAFNNTQIRAGSGAADPELTKLAVETHETQENALPVLERWVQQLHHG